MPYIGVSPFNGVRKKHTYTATASQTSFSGVGAEGITLSYKDSTFVDVYQNGVKLGEADYTSTSGTSIVLGTGAAVNDIVEVVVYDVFSVADTVSKADGGTFESNVTITTADNTSQLTLTSTDADANEGPSLDLFRDSSSPADGDTTGKIKFHAENDASEKIEYTSIFGGISDMTDGTEDGFLRFNMISDGSTKNIDMIDGNINFADNAKAQFGAGSDLQISHDGTNSNIVNSTGSLFIDNGANDADIVFKVTDGSVDTTALTIDASEGGHATFNAGATFGSQINGTNLSLQASSVPFVVDQTSNNLTATFKGAGLGTIELIGTSSGGFIDMTQGSDDFDVRYGGNNSGGYISNNSASFQISGTGSFTCTIVGALSKSSGSFRIDHPLKSKKDTHHLFHSFVEGPQCDNLYRGKIDLVNGTASINIDTKAGMTEGTFVALNRDIQCFTTNETGWTAIKGSVSGNVLTITAQDNSCTDTISWLVIGERQDDEIKASSLTDDDGNLVVEKLKSESPGADQNFGEA